MFIVNNRDTRTASKASTPFSCVFIAEFEQINAGWEKKQLKKIWTQFFYWLMVA